MTDEWIEVGGRRFTPDQLAELFGEAGNPFMVMEAIASVELDRDERVRTYPLTDDPSWTCPDCGHATVHPDDIRNEYCPSCHTFPENRNPPE